VTGTSSDIGSIVLNLTDGDTYTLTATATSLSGTSPSSSGYGITVESPFPPPAPTITGLTAGDGQATVAFSEPSFVGPPVTWYTVTVKPAGEPATETVKADGSPITVKGLTNGKTWAFIVRATNSNGTSSPAAEGIMVGLSPAVLGTPANGTVDDPYSSGFKVTAAPKPTVTLTSGQLPPGLTLGSDGALTGKPTTAGSYTFAVNLHNALGDAQSSATVTIAANVAPTPPTITGLTNGDGQVTVAFSGARDGSASITSYKVSATDQYHPGVPPATATGAGSPIAVRGLTNGDPYVFRVSATSADGTSPQSTPSGQLNVGVAPVITSNPANGTVGETYSSGFTLTGAPRPQVGLATSSDHLPPGLTLDGTGKLTGTPTKAGSYTFTVEAINPVGIDDATTTVVISLATRGAAPPTSSGRHLHATICTTADGHDPTCTTRTLLGSFPQLAARVTATLVRGTVIYAVGHVTAHYGQLTFSRLRPIPSASYTLVLRRAHHVTFLPVTLR
jgi:large repetitive protein